MTDIAITTVTIPKDLHHRIIIPKDVWKLLNLAPEDSIQIEITVVHRAKKQEKEDYVL